jgi:hypothetical protein
MTVMMHETHELSEGREHEIASTSAERRRGLRIRQARPIRVFEPSSARYFGGQTEDISATGLRIELPTTSALHPGDVINVHVGLNRDGACLPNRKHMMPARVVWVDRSIARVFAVVGVEFLSSIAAHLDAA